jgi:hypothetical protein
MPAIPSGNTHSTGSGKIPENSGPWSERRRQVKKIALAGFFLLLVVLGIAYNLAHHSASSGVDAAVPGQSGASAQTGDPGATSASWVTVRDTREKAFSIQVPQGWKTYGGLFRFSTIDARMLGHLSLREKPTPELVIAVCGLTVAIILVLFTRGRLARSGQERSQAA